MIKYHQLPEVCVVLLNWNGWQDTIECVETLLASNYPRFTITIVDNGSTDSSLEKIRAWLQRSAQDNRLSFTENICELTDKEKQAQPEMFSATKHSMVQVVLISLAENLGFAAGSNVGARYALASEVDYVWFLNNDTTVEPESLSSLVHCLESNPDVQVATSQIRYYYTPHRIWNCGGQLQWYGARRYFYSNADYTSAPQSGCETITFVTGCAMFVRSRLLREHGLLTEKFFFGEEDFEFSMRLKKAKILMVCCHDSIVYHKVSTSVERMAKHEWFGRIYVHYLNRFINMRTYMPPIIWHIWRILYLIYITLLLAVKQKRPLRQVLYLWQGVWRQSMRLDSVDRQTFDQCMKHMVE